MLRSRHCCILPKPYQFAWEECDETTEEPSLSDGEWLVLQDSGGLGGELVSLMQSRGMKVQTANHPADVDALIKANGASWLTGIIHLWGMDASEAEPDKALLASLNVMQSLSQAGSAGRHWFVTKGGQAVAEGDVVAPWQTRFWGFGRTLQVEHPEQLGGCIDLEPTAFASSANDLALLVGEITGSGDDTELAFRQGSRYAARLVRPDPCESDIDPHAPLELDGEASYLVTGGMGALGVDTACEICGGDPNRCDEENSPAAESKPLFYEASRG